MKKLLEDGEAGAMETPKPSRIIVRDRSKSVTQEGVEIDAYDEASFRASASRVKQSDDDMEDGVLCLGHTSLIWLRDNRVVFSHPYANMHWYEHSRKENWFQYEITFEKSRLIYEYQISESEVVSFLYQLDIAVIGSLQLENDKQDRRRSKGSPITVGKGERVARSREDIEGKRLIGRLLGSDKKALHVIIFLHSDALAILDFGRHHLRIFEYSCMTGLQGLKDKLGGIKGRVQFDYAHSSVMTEEFDIQLHQITLAFEEPQEALLALHQAKQEVSPGAMESLPASYP